LAFHSGREADPSPPSSAEVKEWVELYLHSPNAPSWRGGQYFYETRFSHPYKTKGKILVFFKQNILN
jgi:hypothetical protein